MRDMVIVKEVGATEHEYKNQINNQVKSIRRLTANRYVKGHYYDKTKQT